MKKLFTFFLTITLLLSLTGCSSEPFEIPEKEATISSNGKYGYFEKADGTIALCSHNGSEKELILPDEIDGHIVSEISDNCFEDNLQLTSVVIPESVSVIGDYAFQNCTSLSDVFIPDTVSGIEVSAFKGTKWLEMQTGEFITAGDGVLLSYTGTSAEVVIPIGIKYISDAFRYNETIVSVTIPDSVTIIDKYAFFRCSTLQTVSIPDSVAEIRTSAFSHTPWLTAQKDNFVIVGGGVLLNYNGFSRTVTIPDGVKYITANVFCMDTIMKTLNLPDSLTIINDEAFENCSRLRNVTIPESVTTIGKGAFRGCKKLADLVLSSSLTQIGDEAFANCTSLESTVIPQTVTFMGSDVYTGCKELTIYCTSPEKGEHWNSNWNRDGRIVNWGFIPPEK